MTIALPEALQGRYEIIQTLGAGGQATVVKLHDTQLNRACALKLFHATTGDEEAARFQRECLLLAGLDHSNLLRIFQAGTSEVGSWILTEYLEGSPLSEPQEDFDPVATILDLAVAVEELHARGVLHRDIKPANVMRTFDGRIVLLDFGLAKHSDSAPLTATGQIVGTPGYLAPELFGHGVPSPATDWYALGVCLFFFLEGRTPFHFVELAIASEGGPLPPLVWTQTPSDLPAAQLAAAFLQSDPDRRPAGLSEVRAILAGDLREPAAPPEAVDLDATFSEADIPPPLQAVDLDATSSEVEVPPRSEAPPKVDQLPRRHSAREKGPGLPWRDPRLGLLLLFAALATGILWPRRGPAPAPTASPRPRASAVAPSPELVRMGAEFEVYLTTSSLAYRSEPHYVRCIPRLRQPGVGDRWIQYVDLVDAWIREVLEGAATPEEVDARLLSSENRPVFLRYVIEIPRGFIETTTRAMGRLTDIFWDVRTPELRALFQDRKALLADIFPLYQDVSAVAKGWVKGRTYKLQHSLAMNLARWWWLRFTVIENAGLEQQRLFEGLLPKAKGSPLAGWILLSCVDFLVIPDTERLFPCDQRARLQHQVLGVVDEFDLEPHFRDEVWRGLVWAAARRGPCGREPGWPESGQVSRRALAAGVAPEALWIEGLVKHR